MGSLSHSLPLYRHAEESSGFDRDSLVVTTEFIKYLFLALDPTDIMPGRTAAKKRTAQRDWMIEQKTKASKQQAEEEEDNDSGVEDKEVEEVEEPIAEVVPEEKPAEDDGPVEDWTKKELMDECNSLEISNKGNKNALIERIKEAWENKKLAIIEEVAVEKVDETEEAVEESLPAEPAAEEITEETLPETDIVQKSEVEKMGEDADTDKSELPEEEDGPLEDWTKKEMGEECKTLGLSDKGNKASLIERIEEARAKAKTESVVEPETIEDKPVEDDNTEETEEVVSTENEIEAEQTSVETEVEAEEAVVSEPVIEESTPIEAEATETKAAKPEEEEEDAPIEEWTKKELVEECKNLGISDKGNKATLVDIIKETWANKKEIAESAAPLEAEEAPVIEAEDVPVAETEPENPSETATEPEASEPMEVEEAETTPSAEEDPAEEENNVEPIVKKDNAVEPVVEEEDGPI